ncbi:transcriptional regulator [Colletotrichum tofieldiae]|nr:transcriptional regulator [Colletotrichum tofieldiae]
MAPSDKKLEAALLDTVRDVFKTDLDNLTVNFIRKRVESDLELEDGFFSSAKWKDKSKKLVKELATALMEGNADPDPEPAENEEVAKPKKTGKRQSADTSPPAKRRKRASATKAENLEGSDSESEKPKAKAKAKAKPKKKAAPRKKKQDTPVIDSDSEPSPVKTKPSKAHNGRAGKAEDSGSDDLSSPPASDDEKADSEKEKPEDDNSKAPEEEIKVSVEMKEDDPAEKQPEATVESKNKEQTAVDDTSSELSDVIDEPPKPKRKKKEAGAGSKTPKQKKAPAAPENPDDAEVKKLQSQLVKCGIRKIWGFELKQYGDNTKAKIKHLRDMLKDIGMDGRFSEAKAKEIKERRELEADLEAVQEMNANWGAGGRSSRSKARGQPGPTKAVKDDLSEDENVKQNDDDDDEEQEAHIPSRARGKARADLAFLGDDDEDSD